uniref:STAS domain-containing protein n=1 Tax=Kalanchoe fedtschenkoi TaxID=63787 RepID=A0A7N0ZSG9_KALFE
MSDGRVPVNFGDPRKYSKVLKSDVKEALFPDDPFRQFRHPSKLQRFKNGLCYFVPMVEWLPNYTLSLFKFDLLSGITIASLAIPQGISYAKLANIPPIIGLYSSFIPPLIYAVFGSSKNIAVGTVAASSLLIAQNIGEEVSVDKNPTLYLNLVFTTAFITGVFQTALGFLRLGILVDFLSHSTITGFMCGTATIIILQQLKGFFGLVHFTSKTDVVSVIGAIIHNWKEEEELTKGNDIEHIILDLSGVTAIDMSGIETLDELRKSLGVNGVKITLVNPRIDIMEKMLRSKFIDKIGKESVFLSVEEAIESCKFSLNTSKRKSNGDHSNTSGV